MNELDLMYIIIFQNDGRKWRAFFFFLSVYNQPSWQNSGTHRGNSEGVFAE